MCCKMGHLVDKGGTVGGKPFLRSWAFSVFPALASWKCFNQSIQSTTETPNKRTQELTVCWILSYLRPKMETMGRVFLKENDVYDTIHHRLLLCVAECEAYSGRARRSKDPAFQRVR